MNPGCRVRDQLNTSEPTAPYIIGRESQKTARLAVGIVPTTLRTAATENDKDQRLYRIGHDSPRQAVDHHERNCTYVTAYTSPLLHHCYAIVMPICLPLLHCPIVALFRPRLYNIHVSLSIMSRSSHRRYIISRLVHRLANFKLSRSCSQARQNCLAAATLRFAVTQLLHRRYTVSLFLRSQTVSLTEIDEKIWKNFPELSALQIRYNE